MHVDAVLFDLFDTLVLIGEYEVYYPPSLEKLHRFLTKNGIHIPFEEFKRVYFEVRDKFYAESRKSLEEPHFNVRISQTLQRFGYKFGASDPLVAGATMAFAEEFMHYVSLDADTLDILKKLHGKYKLGLISNFAIPECGWKLLEKFSLKEFFDVVLISGEVNRRKPSPEIFEKALKTLGVKASKAVFIGDMLDLDVAGPKKVGMKTIFIRRKSLEEIVNVKPDKTINRLSELPAILEDC